jgi:hypothetical protein
VRSDSLTNPDPVGVCVYSVESASRTAFALDTRASLLHAVERPAMDTAMVGEASASAARFWSRALGFAFSTAFTRTSVAGRTAKRMPSAPG